jgi:hypothetical protein
MKDGRKKRSFCGVEIDAFITQDNSSMISAVSGSACWFDPYFCPSFSTCSSCARSCSSTGWPISYTISGKNRSAQIPGILQMAVEPLPTMHPSGEAWAALGHPVAPDKMALAVGSSGSTFADHGMRWDNSGKNGHYAPINWSN